jgi:protein-disulfide isomerase
MVNPPPRKAAGANGSRRLFYIILIVLLVIGVAALSILTSRSSNSVTQVDSTLAPVPNQGHVIGNDSAPVEVVEFADFECPACGNFANLTEPDIRERLVNTGQVRFRFIDFPLQMHRNTRAAHLAAWCAGDLGKFWEMHDALFQTQDRWNGEATSRPAGALEDLAKRVGLNADQYNACMDSRKFAPQIQANVNEGMRRGIGSTPTFIIGSKQVATSLPYDEFKRYVDEALVQARAARSTATKSPPGR